ncbi:MAG: AMP-binding protein, partial [Candidatus Hydrothermae bacterium]|nr:AMP-binding protein [Candidatus Hydrothermae bacterium]
MSEILATKKLRTIRPGRGVVTIPEFFERSVREYANHVIFRKRAKNGVDFDTYTYEEAGRIVRRLARVFVETFGLKPGTHAAVIGDNRPEWAFAYFAIHWAGGVVVPVDARLTPTEIRHNLGPG